MGQKGPKPLQKESEKSRFGPHFYWKPRHCIVR